MEIRKLNTLRGLAALIVFFTHFSDITQWLGGALGGGTGAYGVMLFFILSGFLMGYLYLSRPFTQAQISQYVKARIARVVPLFLLVVFASYLLHAFSLPGLYDITHSEAVLGHLLFLYGDSVLWTIPAEVHFYLLFIGFWALAKSRPGYIYLIVFATLIALFLTNVPRVFGDINGVPYNAFNTLRSLPFFFVGMLMGMAYPKLTIPSYLKKHSFVSVLCLVPLLFPEWSPVSADAKRRMWLSYEVLLVMSAVFFTVVFLVPDTNRLLANPIGDFLGKISYGLYLLHMPVIAATHQLGFDVLTTLFISLSMSILVATLSFYAIEQPLAKRIRAKRKATFNGQVVAER